MNKLILFATTPVFSLILTSTVAGASAPDTVLVTCLGSKSGISLVVSADDQGVLRLREKGYSGDRVFIVRRESDGFQSLPRSKGTIGEISFTHQENGMYRVIMGGGFSGGFEFEESECSFR